MANTENTVLAINVSVIPYLVHKHEGKFRIIEFFYTFFPLPIFNDAYNRNTYF